MLKIIFNLNIQLAIYMKGKVGYNIYFISQFNEENVHSNNILACNKFLCVLYNSLGLKNRRSKT